MDRQAASLATALICLPGSWEVELRMEPGLVAQAYDQHSGRLRQEDHKLKACLGYRRGLPAGSYLDSLFVCPLWR